MKIFWLFNHPAPYKVDLFNILGAKSELTACFERVSESGRNELFYSRPALSFKPVLCKGIKFPSYQSYSTTPIEEIKRGDYDAIVINGYSTMTEMRTISYLRSNGIPYFFCINGGIVKKSENPAKRWLKRKYISGASHYLSPDANSSLYLVHYGAEPNKISLYPYSSVFASEVLANPLDEQEKLRIREEEFGVKEGHLFVSAGQFIARKGYLPLIRQWARMPSSYNLLIAGDGEGKRQCQDEIDSLALHNVRLLPYLKKEKALRLFSCADAFLFPTKEDIYGHVVNEALCSGTPVISSPESNAAKKLVKDGETGFIIDFGDDRQLSAALEYCISRDLSSHCLEVARQNTLELEAKAILEILGREA